MKKRKNLMVMGVLLVFAVLLLAACKKDPVTTSKSSEEKTEKTYRNVKVMEVEGTVTLKRGEKERKVYAELVIKGGDEITTASDGVVGFRLDEDKYAKLGADSKAKFELKGNPQKGAIRIYLSEGSIYNKIENPLSKEDSYEIHTPDGVMAVRGTSFEVHIFHIDGKRETHVTTLEGTVNVKLNNSNQDEANVNAGETVVIDGGMPGNEGEPEEPSLRKEILEEPQEPQEPTIVPLDNNSIICYGCTQTVSDVNLHKSPCNVSGHYTCDGKTHSACDVCGKLLCDANVHTFLECGVHYPCHDEQYAFDGHERMECGHHMCSLLENPEMPHGDKCVTCGEMTCYSSRQHTWAECGCTYCGTMPTTGHGECEFCYSCIGNGQQHGNNICNVY